MEEKSQTLAEMQLVVFDLASEHFGVDISDVREIMRLQAITHVPGAPAFVEGVINLRGRVLPVLDLRKRLKLKVSEQTKETRIVVVCINNKDVGVIVDAVTEVLRIPTASIDPPSSLVTNTDSDYLRGIAKLETKLIILLDLSKVLALDEILAATEAGLRRQNAAQKTESAAKVSASAKVTAGAAA
jgi:purine-binding chemotaxis protein CheW